MAPADFLPLVFALALVATLWLARVNTSVGRVFTRTALTLFGRSVRQAERVLPSRTSADASRMSALRGAHISATYRAYSANTYLYAGLVGIAAAILGVYLLFGVLQLFAIPEETVRSALPRQVSFLAAWMRAPQLSIGQQFGLFLLSSATVGLTAAVATYKYRWYLPKYRGGVRARRIDESVQRSVAFIYALSRSGMEIPEILRILADNTEVYGEAAREMEVAVRDMEVFGTNIISALQRLAQRTPSEKFGDFAENFVSVLQGSRDVSNFLREQYEYYEEEAKAQQQQFLELLATLAEAYVTAFVAGPLFLITILVVIGFVIGDTLTILRVIVYGAIPLATVGFLVYLDSITPPTSLAPDREESESAWEGTAVRSVEDPTVPREDTATDGGPSAGFRTVDGRRYPEAMARNVKRLLTYNRLRGIRDRIQDPLGYILSTPTSVLYIVVPVALVYAGIRASLLSSGGSLSVATIDDVLVQSLLVVVGVFAVVYESRQYRVRAIERAIPDFLDRLASINEAGMPIVESFHRIQRSDLGALNVELERVWADVQMGAELDQALHRLEGRLDTASVSRAVTLITHSMNASGDLAPVLRIAANEALTMRRLARQRRQELLTYVVVIYVAFFVFLAIIVALTIVFLPSIPTIESAGGSVGEPGATPTLARSLNVGLTEAQKTAYQLVLGHAAVVQGLGSGLMAGKMSEGDVRAGAKHVAVMVGVAYAVMLVFL